jgi:hypothetical protein
MPSWAKTVIALSRRAPDDTHGARCEQIETNDRMLRTTCSTPLERHAKNLRHV